MPAANQPLILDFDASVLSLSDSEIRIQLGDWQEKIRFGSSLADYAALEKYLSPLLPENYGPVFMGSGDYHHLSLFLIRQRIKKLNLGPNSLEILVLDNHPDNMRYPFGLHCGSWVRAVSRLPEVRRVHVAGICSGDIAWPHAWENYLAPFRAGKLHYWSIGVEAGWLKLIGRKAQAWCFATPNDLIEELASALKGNGPLYLSIDKDVFGREVLQTDWDQGELRPAHLEELINVCGKRVVGSDVCGEISHYEYASRFKRFLSGLDGQSARDPSSLPALQQAHQAFNKRILELLEILN